MLVSPKGRRPDLRRCSQQPARSILSPSLTIHVLACSLFPSCPRRRAAPAGRRTLRGHAPRTRPRARPVLASSLAAAAATSSLHLIGARRASSPPPWPGWRPSGWRCAALRDASGAGPQARGPAAPVSDRAAAGLRLSKHQKWSYARPLLLPSRLAAPRARAEGGKRAARRPTARRPATGAGWRR
jgi:hypothetical protein